MREIEASFGIAFRLCIYDERDNEKITTKYFFYNIDTFP